MRKSELFLRRSRIQKLYSMLRDFALASKKLKIGFAQLEAILLNSRSKKAAILSLQLLKERQVKLERVVLWLINQMNTQDKITALKLLRSNLLR